MNKVIEVAESPMKEGRLWQPSSKMLLWGIEFSFKKGEVILEFVDDAFPCWENSVTAVFPDVSEDAAQKLSAYATELAFQSSCWRPTLAPDAWALYLEGK